jgi:hypothetical protein
MLTLPLYNSLLPSGGAKIGDFVLGGTPRMTASAVIGLLVLLAAAQLTRGLRSRTRRCPAGCSARARPGRPGDPSWRSAGSG